MRVPVVFVLRVFVMALLSSAGLVSYALAVQRSTLPVNEPAACAAPGATAYRSGDTIVIDRRAPSVPATVSYRVDSRTGFWTYPPTQAEIAVLGLPATTDDPLYVSVEAVTDGFGTTRCVSTATEPLVSMAIAPAAIGAAEHLAPGAPTVDPMSCDRPFAPANVVRAVAPDESPLAMQQGVNGIVNVDVEIDADGHVIGTKIVSTPSPLVTGVVLTAARTSTYTAAVFRCRPVASHTIFRVHYQSR